MRSILLSALVALAVIPATVAGATSIATVSPVQSVLDSGTPTLAPFAHIRFCKSHPDACRADGRAARIRIETATLSQIRDVNTRVNRSIRPVNDRRGAAGDVWSLSPRRGDCDDYAVTKRQALLEVGFPVAALRLLVATAQNGEGHAVLVVTTSEGDLVLDNLTDRVRPLGETGLRPLKVQSSADPRRWIAVTRQTIASRD